MFVVVKIRTPQYKTLKEVKQDFIWSAIFIKIIYSENKKKTVSDKNKIWYRTFGKL